MERLLITVINRNRLDLITHFLTMSVILSRCPLSQHSSKESAFPNPQYINEQNKIHHRKMSYLKSHVRIIYDKNVPFGVHSLVSTIYFEHEIKDGPTHLNEDLVGTTNIFNRVFIVLATCAALQMVSRVGQIDNMGGSCNGVLACACSAYGTIPNFPVVA